MFLKPEGLELWFKFDMSSICNAAQPELLSFVLGKPKRVPKGKGIYRDWGYLFNLDSAIELSGGLAIGREWTFMFWTVLPSPDTRAPRTLLSSDEGALFQIDEAGSRMGVVD